MADYKRFVSYMYEYVNGVKKKNVGYARVEIRNGECRFTIHMQLEGLLEGIFPTYLIHRPDEEMDLIYLGDCSVKNQVMDSRLYAKESNIMDSGHNFSEIGGILLFLNSEVFYATQWDDKPVVLEEVLEALKPKDKFEEPEPIMPATKMPEADTDKEQSDAVTDENRPIYMLPGGWKMKESAQHAHPRTPVNPWRLVERYKELEAEKQKESDTVRKDIPDKTTERELISEKTTEIKSAAEDVSVAEEKLQKENPVVEKIFTNYPRIYPFEDNEVTRCVKIEPKDIGALPSDTWVLSNNSFLLHGFYCYHHLIFAEIIDRFGCRYILGVPGIYHNRERFMARMFGFECFKSIRKRELKQGDFGYWYMEIKVY